MRSISRSPHRGKRLAALLAVLVSVLGSLTVLGTASPAMAADCAAAWSSGAVYTGGMTASYNGGASSCTPTGNPSAPVPNGTLMAG